MFTEKNVNKIVIVLLAISVVAAAISLLHRETGTDDAWLAEQAYWMAKDGYVRSELFYGMNNHHERHLTYHRLLIWHGALANKLFGWTPYVFKSVSLLYFFLFLGVSYLYIRNTKILKDRTEYYLFYLFVISMTLIVKLAFSYRSDLMAMTLGFASFAALHISIRDEKGLIALASGAFAGLSVLSHLNGVVFVMAGGTVLLLQRRYRLFILFSIAAIVVSLLYFVEFRSLEMFNEFMRQFRGSPALREHDFKIWGPIYKLLLFYKPYFFKGTDASYTLLFIFVFWTKRQIIFSDPNLKLIFQYFVLVAVALVMVSPEFKSLYLIYAAPYAFLLITVLFKNNITEQPAKRYTYLVLLSLFLLTQWGGTVKLFNKRTPHLVEENRQVMVSMEIPEGSRIVAPLTFIFDEIDRYTIQTFFAYRIMAGQGKFDLNKDFFRMASEDNREFIILSEVDVSDMGLELHTGKMYGRYIYLGRFSQYYGFRLKASQNNT